MSRDGEGGQGLRALLARDHRRVQALLDGLLDDFEEDDRADLRDSWKRFEEGLSAHLAAEESYLLPQFARVEPEEAARLAADHDAFRARLAELGVGVDLHSVRLATVRELADALEAHARREDELFYRWAEGASASDRAAVEGGLAGAGAGRDR